jgi:2-polyprenyl-3-methyl-5-hydroxy-6-metoxy-1,4-benzoquinol methylase
VTVTDGVEEEREAKRLREGHYWQSSTCGIPWEEGRPSAQLVELVESSSDERKFALDMGTGSGDNAIYLAQNGFGCSGLDFSEAAVRRARDKAGRGVSASLRWRMQRDSRMLQPNDC